MRSLLIIAVAILAAGTAQAQVKGQISTPSSLVAPSKSALQATTTNVTHRSVSNPRVIYSGSAVQAVKSRRPLQLINPVAPASYGTGQANTSHDPVSGRADGFKIFSIAFW